MLLVGLDMRKPSMHKMLGVDVEEDAVEKFFAFLGDGVELLVEEITSNFLPVIKLKILIFLIQAIDACKDVL